MNDGRYFIVFAIVVFSLLGGCAGLAYVEDPGGLFIDDTIYLQLTDLLLSGNNVTNLPTNFDESKFRTLFISKDFNHRDAIIFGSSRVMVINKTVLTPIMGENNSIMNNFRSSASLKSELCLFELYAQKGNLPTYVILGIDPYTLDKSDNQNQMSDDLLSAGMKRIGHNVSHPVEFPGLTRYISMISRPYIMRSLQELFANKFSLKKEFTPPKTTSQSFDSSDYTYHPDGTKSLSRVSMQKSEEQIDQEVQSFISNSLPKYYLHFKFDPELVSIFTTFIEYLQKQNIRVYLYLSPQHPAIYESALKEKEKRTFLEEERFLTSFAHDHNITLIGSFDPRPWNLSSKDYYDWSHPKYEVITKIFASYNSSPTGGRES
jgi:hypothetical protein